MDFHTHLTRRAEAYRDEAYEDFVRDFLDECEGEGEIDTLVFVTSDLWGMDEEEVEKEVCSYYQAAADERRERLAEGLQMGITS